VSIHPDKSKFSLLSIFDPADDKNNNYYLKKDGTIKKVKKWGVENLKYLFSRKYEKLSLEKKREIFATITDDLVLFEENLKSFCHMDHLPSPGNKEKFLSEMDHSIQKLNELKSKLNKKIKLQETFISAEEQTPLLKNYREQEKILQLQIDLYTNAKITVSDVSEISKRNLITPNQFHKTIECIENFLEKSEEFMGDLFVSNEIKDEAVIFLFNIENMFNEVVRKFVNQGQELPEIWVDNISTACASVDRLKKYCTAIGFAGAFQESLHILQEIKRTDPACIKKDVEDWIQDISRRRNIKTSRDDLKRLNVFLDSEAKKAYDVKIGLSENVEEKVSLQNEFNHLKKLVEDAKRWFIEE